jgi:hypothetical protein
LTIFMPTKMSPFRLFFTIALCLVGEITPALGQGQSSEPFAYPTRGQTPDQQQQDHFACYSWAKQQTGVDPSQLPSAATAQSPQQGQVVKGAAKGSLLGVVGGAIGGNVGEGAAIGAGVGALAGIFRKREEQQQQAQAQAQTNTAEQEKLQTYYRAWTACMQGRGYNVN